MCSYLLTYYYLCIPCHLQIMGEVIGKGAAAEVHKAINEETGETVAIKKMRKSGMKAEQVAAVAVRLIGPTLSLHFSHIYVHLFVS